MAVQRSSGLTSTGVMDGNARRCMGQQAAADAHQRFCLERQVDDYLEWYTEILEEMDTVA